MKIVVVITCFLYSVISFAQIELAGSFSKDTIVIGDEVELTISAEVDEGVEVLGVAAFFLDSVYSALQSYKVYSDTTKPIVPQIADYEIVSSGGWEDINQDGIFGPDELKWNISSIGNKRLLEQTFTLKLWDPGENIVLYPGIIYSLDGVQDQLIKEEQIKVIVAPPGGIPASQDSIKIAPIKNIQEEAINLSDYLFYFIVVGLALLFGLIYWLYTKYTLNRARKAEEESIPVIRDPAHKIALAKLSDLNEKGLWQKGEVKHYQTELTYIIREYLEGRYEIAALESTTDEIVKKLVTELSNEQDVISLKRILQVADLVKFAKAKPAHDIHQSFMDEAVDFVSRTKLELDNEEVK